MKYQLPALPYAYDALEPYIDARTMEIHHTKHHQTYIDKLNGVLEHYPTLADKPIETLLKDIETLAVEEKDRKAIRNHGGGYINHNLFWKIMGAKKEIDAELAADVTKAFGSLDEFKKVFTETATNHFGSGWAWLVRDERNALQVYSLPNQDSPHLKGHIPLIGLDVWEHAYYLKYQNQRGEYIQNWWDVLKVL